MLSVTAAARLSNTPRFLPSFPVQTEFEGYRAAKPTENEIAAFKGNGARYRRIAVIKVKTREGIQYQVEALKQEGEIESQDVASSKGLAFDQAAALMDNKGEGQ